MLRTEPARKVEMWKGQKKSTKLSWALVLPFPALYMGREEAESSGEDTGVTEGYM